MKNTQSVLLQKILKMHTGYIKLAAVTNMNFGYRGIDCIFLSNFRYEIGMKDGTIIFHRNNVDCLKSCSDFF